jgi:hypothetical protein
MAFQIAPSLIEAFQIAVVSDVDQAELPASASRRSGNANLTSPTTLTRRLRREGAGLPVGCEL